MSIYPVQARQHDDAFPAIKSLLLLLYTQATRHYLLSSRNIGMHFRTHTHTHVATEDGTMECLLKNIVDI